MPQIFGVLHGVPLAGGFGNEASRLQVWGGFHLRSANFRELFDRVVPVRAAVGDAREKPMNLVGIQEAKPVTSQGSAHTGNQVRGKFHISFA